MLNINSRQIFFYVAVIGLLIFLHVAGLLHPIEASVTRTLSSPLSNLYSASTDIRAMYNEQSDKRDLVNEVDQLEIKVRQLTQENSQLKSYEEENKTLKEMLNFYDTHEFEYAVANIISRSDIIDPAINDQTIIIDKGSRHGVGVGFPVITSEGIIIGKIFEVKDEFSKVYLTTNPNCKLAATLQNMDKTSGVVEGDLGLTIKMDFIPQTENVTKSDIVITSGLEENIPRGLIIGKVAIINRESNELWQTATIEPMMDFDELVIVSVLKQ